VLWPALALAARVLVTADAPRANTLASEVLSEWRARDLASSGSDAELLPDLAVVLVALGRQAEFPDAIGGTPWRRAAAAYASGDFLGAAEQYASIGALPEEAYARLRGAEVLVQEGRRAEADAELEQALAFCRSVGATAYVREGESLLAAAG
jgi:tetratricopeptide (TPR) repeat protein